MPINKNPKAMNFKAIAIKKCIMKTLGSIGLAGASNFIAASRRWRFATKNEHKAVLHLNETKRRILVFSVNRN